jgi:hypothetical protein
MRYQGGKSRIAKQIGGVIDDHVHRRQSTNRTPNKRENSEANVRFFICYIIQKNYC